MPDPIDPKTFDGSTPPAPAPAEEEFFSAMPQSPEQVAAIRSGQSPVAQPQQERIPGYRFVRRLGKGGMGEV